MNDIPVDATFIRLRGYPGKHGLASTCSTPISNNNLVTARIITCLRVMGRYLGIFPCGCALSGDSASVVEMGRDGVKIMQRDGSLVSFPPGWFEPSLNSQSWIY